MVKRDDPRRYHGVCRTCMGMGFYVYDVQYGHPQFGKLIRCDCNGGRQPDPSPFSDFELPDDVRDATFDTIVALPQIVPVIEVARTLVTPPHGLLTLAGQPGVGKTENGGCLVNAARSAGIPALYARASDLFKRLYEGTRQGAAFEIDAALQTLHEIPVLCIDDLHTVDQWAWAQGQLHELICKRYDERRKRLTCLITNDSIDSWPDYVQSRIRDVECYLFELTGQDVRQRKR